MTTTIRELLTHAFTACSEMSILAENKSRRMGSPITILHPMLATSLYAAGGMNAVIMVDLCTFLIAFFSLLLFVRIPPAEASSAGEK